MFSSFGVLHVYPDQPADSLTLAQWQREAVLYKAISAIPFFKHYLVRKAYKRCVEFVFERSYLLEG